MPWAGPRERAGPPTRSSLPGHLMPEHTDVPCAAILDVDGTLIDSNDAHAHAWVDTFAEFGRDLPFERVRPLIGMGGDKLLPEISGLSKDSEDGEKLSERRTQIFRERYVPTLRPFPHARELLERMRADGLKLVVATSARESELEGLLRAAGVEDLLHDTTTSSDAEHSKPDPDIVQAALDRSGCDADSAVMLGDTPYDIEAATKAGITIVALRCGGWGDDDLGGAAAIYEDPADLLAQYETSPFARAAARSA